MVDPEKWDEYLQEWMFNAEKAGISRECIVFLLTSKAACMAVRLTAERRLNGN
jgi:hypothetical protein